MLSAVWRCELCPLTLVMVQDSNDSCGLINVQCIPTVWLLIGLWCYTPLIGCGLTATNQCDEEGSEPVILQIPNYNRVLCCVRVAKTWSIEAAMTRGSKFDNCFHSSGRFYLFFTIFQVYRWRAGGHWLDVVRPHLWAGQDAAAGDRGDQGLTRDWSRPEYWALIGQL